MKKLVKINNKNNIDKYMSFCDGFILGLKNYSVDYYEFNIDEITDISSNCNKDIFVAINKNIFNSELEELEKILFELDKINIKGVLFYDLSLIYIKKKNNLNIDLVWNQTHMVTNYNTCNYYYDKGCKYGFLSGELTLNEINEIICNTKMELMLLVVGHQVMSHSRRKLLSNYYFSINKKYDNCNKNIYERESSFIVKEDKTGTIFKTSKILNAIPYISEINNNISYLVIDEDMIDSDVIIEILIVIDNIINNNDYDLNIKNSYKLIGDYTSFLFNKTIYKVKKDNK